MGIQTRQRVKNRKKKQAMKVSSSIVILSGLASAGQVKTLVEKPDEDRKVPNRHPLQRLWRLYQFSEEIIQEHFYKPEVTPGFPAKKLDRMRARIGKWQYLASRQSYLIGTKRRGFYDENKQHGGPTNDNNADNNIDNHTINDINTEQTQLTDNANEHSPDSMDINNPRPRRSDEEDDDFFDFLDNERYDRVDPCRGIKQIETGFKKWAHRYIGGCGGQYSYKHQFNRAEKFYAYFVQGLGCINPGDLWKPKN